MPASAITISCVATGYVVYEAKTFMLWLLSGIQSMVNLILYLYDPCTQTHFSIHTIIMFTSSTGKSESKMYKIVCEPCQFNPISAFKYIMHACFTYTVRVHAVHSSAD